MRNPRDSVAARAQEREAKPDERDARRRRPGRVARESANLAAAGNRRRKVSADLDRLGGGNGHRVGTAGRSSRPPIDRKSTRLNSSHVKSSYAVFCLKK